MLSLSHIPPRLQKLAEDGLTDVNDFDWLAQLRYYFSEKLLGTRMINAALAYGYEYLGNSGASWVYILRSQVWS